MGTEHPRLLLLTASFGEGHNQAAYAIQEAALDLNANAEVRVLDFMQWASPKLDSFAQYCLYQSCLRVPSLYGYLYKATDRVSPGNLMNRPIGLMGRNRLLHYLQQFDPTWVVSTFPISASVVSRMREIGKADYRTATVITDLYPHSQWIHPCTDKYFVATDQVRYILRLRGVQRSRIHVTGIPVRKRFAEPIEVPRELIKEMVDLDPQRPAVLISGGGAGIFPDLKECLELLARHFIGLQVIVVCGRNESLKTELELLKKAAGWSNVKILGFVTNFHEYLAAADLVIGKSGGLTTAESLAMGSPMMIYRPLPGQESYNAKHLVRGGAALLAMNPFDMVAHLNRLLKEPRLLDSLRQNAVLMGRGRAAAQIAEQLLIEGKVASPVKHA